MFRYIHWAILFALTFPMLSSPCRAEMELQRPLASSIQSGEIELWGQLDYFSPSLDLTNYAGKFSRSSSLDRFTMESIGFHYGLPWKLNLRYAFGLMQEKVTRATEPRNINTDAFMHDLRLQYMIHKESGLRLAAELGYLRHQAKAFDFYAFQFGGTVIRRKGRPFGTLTGKDQAWETALRSAWKVNNDIWLHLSGELRRYKVEARMQSDDPLINLFFVPPIAPQRSPWRETHVLLQLGLDWQLSRNLKLLADYAHTNITRSGYRPVAGKADYRSQDQLDVYLGWQLAAGWNIYGHGRIYRHFVLADLPMTYNQRTSHLFKHPFGMLSMGVSWTH